MIDHVLAACTHILGRQGCARNSEACTQCNHEECHGKADRHRGHGRRAQPSDPESVGKLVAGLQDIAQNDGNGEPE